MEIRAAVLRGAALLDEVRPGWEFEIDLGKFDLINCNNCVLGQLWGDYYAGAIRLFPDDFAYDVIASTRHGFSASIAIEGAGKEWVTLILARRAEADAPQPTEIAEVVA